MVERAPTPTDEGSSPQPAKIDADSLRLLVESVKDYAIFMLDPGGYVATWNAGAERIKGYRADEIIGQHFSSFYPRSDVDAGKCEHELEVAGREGRFEDEGWRVRKDGTTFWANVVITALRDGTGRLVGFGKVTRDLTSRIRGEQERIQLARAEEGERRKEEFLAIMGHELRNPLAPMLTAVHVIKLRRGANCEREIAVLDRQILHMMRLLDDLTDVSRMLRDKVVLSTRPTDIGEVLANAIEVSASLIEQKRHTLRLDVPTTPALVVDVDAARMTQVFSNLLNNAAKYTDGGGEIRVRAGGGPGDVFVAIEDTGLGIEPGMLKSVFELFTQGLQSRERALGGFGVGLAVAKRLVTAHGGTITAESAGPGLGSRFTVRLPRAVVADEVSDAAPSHAAAHAPVRRRVLIVDDNEDSREMVATLLAQLGHEVRTAPDGGRALEIAQEFSPDIAFLDIGLPGMTGYVLAQRLRQTPACAAIPIIAISGYARDADRQEAIAAGFTEHFAKPIDPARLEELVEHA